MFSARGTGEQNFIFVRILQCIFRGGTGPVKIVAYASEIVDSLL